MKVAGKNLVTFFFTQGKLTLTLAKTNTNSSIKVPHP